jgi:hypothetical protein
VQELLSDLARLAYETVKELMIEAAGDPHARSRVVVVPQTFGNVLNQSSYFRRDVTLARAAPDDFTVDQYHPDVEDLDPAGYRDTFVEQKLGSAFFAEAGLDSPVPVGSFFDLFPMSVLTTSTLDQLRELRPQSRFDQRRFRMNTIGRLGGPRSSQCTRGTSGELGAASSPYVLLRPPVPRGRL